MVTYSIIQKSQLEGGLRLDAEYYQPEYLNNAKIIATLPYDVKKFADLASYITNGHTPLHADLSIGDVYFLTAENVFDFFIDYGTAKRITKLASKTELKRTILSDNDLLITIKGRVGNAAIVYKLQQDTNINQDVARVVVKKGISPFYLSAFLNSKFGKLQVERIATNQINPFLGLGNLKELLVPIIEIDKQEEIEKLIKKGLDELENSISLYSQAENLLLEELGLKDFQVEDDLSYIVNLSEIKSAHRADAEYFQPKYEKLIEKIKKYGSVPLLDLVQNVPARFNPKSQPTKLFRYIELSNITSSVGTIDGFSEVSGDEAPSRAKRVLKANDVIFSSVEGSLGKVALAGKEQEEYLASNGFFQFRSKNILPEVLLVLAKSFVLQMQFEKETTGTILTAVPKEAVKNIIVPKIEKTIQQKIAELVRKSHEARLKAKQLLKEAKNKVENLIETKL
ncbi:hypothetical protein B5M47_00090 [candidate division CPR3 bacterium 4484_211]|uniref:Type I restriction modification DNA specificity domain-containing protein n=1 Tax=candidate division CPR3 bacterium 4484_211 TaxID=1968527 RepID=A0A1W9NZL7_UNCC3|nr:MAG: hypothetical protein B5M47_00090 [candidate division CPR3 bacterium 4484_211]